MKNLYLFLLLIFISTNIRAQEIYFSSGINTTNFDYKSSNGTDENLNFSLKQKLVFDRIEYIFSIYDNIFRVLLPLIFFIYISYIMSHEK